MEEEQDDNQEMQAVLGFSSFGPSDKNKKQSDISTEPQNPAKRQKMDVQVRGKDTIENQNQDTVTEPTQQPTTSETAQTTPNAGDAEWESQQALKYNCTIPAHPEYQPTLKEWAKGVQMPGGDVAYFLPEFVDEDPWKQLRKT